MYISEVMNKHDYVLKILPRIDFWPIWALFEWSRLLSLRQPLQIILFNLIFFLPLGHVHLWSDEQARLCPKDAESCRSRIDFRHFLPGCSALFVQDFPRYLDAYQPVYGYCCTAFNQGHTDIFVIWRLFLRHMKKKKIVKTKQTKKITFQSSILLHTLPSPTTHTQLDQIAKSRPKKYQKNREIDRSYLFLQQWSRDQKWIWWNLLRKNRQITSSWFVFGGF